MVSLISIASPLWTREPLAALLISDKELKVMYLAGSLAGSQVMSITSSDAVLFCPCPSYRGVGFLSATPKSLQCCAGMSTPSRCQPSDTDAGCVIFQLVYIKRYAHRAGMLPSWLPVGRFLMAKAGRLSERWWESKSDPEPSERRLSYYVLLYIDLDVRGQKVWCFVVGHCLFLF